MSCLAERSFGERKDLGRRNREHQDGASADLMPEGAFSNFVMPASVPYRCPRLGETPEHVLVRDPDGLTLDNDVQALLPLVAAGRKDDVPVASQIDGLLFARAGGKVDGIVQPNSRERGDMGSTIGSDRRNPGQLGLLEHTSGLVPPSSDSVRGAEARVELSVGISHGSRASPALDEANVLY